MTLGGIIESIPLEGWALVGVFVVAGVCLRLLTPGRRR
jgi:hypothetical protein